MLRLSVQLEAGSEAGAAAAVAALADCSAAEPDVLRIACIQAVDAGARGAACQALRCLLERCSRGSADVGGGEKGGSSGSAPGEGASASGSLHAKGYEATVFQNLIHLLVSDEAGGGSGGPMAAATAPAVSAPTAAADASSAPAQPAVLEHSAELARLFDQLVDRMRAVGGPEAFFLQQDGRHTQLEWFAATVRRAWARGMGGLAWAGRLREFGRRHAAGIC